LERFWRDFGEILERFWRGSGGLSGRFIVFGLVAFVGMIWWIDLGVCSSR
jgi:hypothetical protein